MAQTNAERLTKISAEIVKLDSLISSLLDCPKPTYTVDGQTFKWGEYLKQVREMRESLQAEEDRLTDITGGHGFEATQVFVEG